MAAECREPKTHLSKHVLEMKFMQRSVARKEQVENEAEQQRQIDDEHWVLDLPETQQKESCYIVEPSYMAVAGLVFGRRSFQAFNKEIEKLMRSSEAEKMETESEAREREDGVSDDEMASRYSSLIDTMGKKFAKKRKSGDAKNEKSKKKNKKNKFLKPSDD